MAFHRSVRAMKTTSIIVKFILAVSSILSISLVYNNCATKPFESQTAYNYNNTSMVPEEPGETSLRPLCMGEFPEHSSQCYGDDQGLNQDLSKALVPRCTDARKCEFICSAGYNYENGACRLPPVIGCGVVPCTNGVNCSLVTGSPSQVAQPWVKNATSCGFTCNEGFEGEFCNRITTQPVYSCLGAVPNQAVLCDGDEANLTLDQSRIVVTQCSLGRKCEFTCRPGFNNVNGVCVAVTNNSCASTVPCDVGRKCTTTTGNPVQLNQAWVKGATNCGFTCTANFEGALCETEKPATFVCQGSVPLNAVACANDEQNLTMNSSRQVVASCTSQKKCEYVCDLGFNNQNGVCVRQTNACNVVLPCVNGLNCQLQTGTPTSVNQPWVKEAAACGFTCLPGYEGDTCERGQKPPLVSCVNVQNTFPLATHWSESIKGFEEGATGQMNMYNPDASVNRQIYNYGILPRHNNYLGETYEYRKISDSEFLNWSNGECQRSGVGIEHRKPSSYKDWTVAKSAVIGNRGTLQILYGLISDKSLVAVILPPGWNPTDPPGKYPIVFSGHYDLGNHLIGPNHQMFQTLSLAYKNLGTPAIGVLWNGAGAIGSRSLQSNARLEFNKVIQKVKTTFGGDAQKIFIYGGSRGGLTAISMATNPENFPYKVVAAYAAVPPADFPFVASLTGSTVPHLIGAAEWSIGTLETWKKDFRYKENNELKGMTRDEAHLHVLAGTKDKDVFESQINLTSPYMLNSLKAKAPRLFLELGSHDFIVPWVDQFKYFNTLKNAGIQFESRINYLAGHYSDTGSPYASADPMTFSQIVKDVAAGTYVNIFNHGRHVQYMNDYKARALRPIDDKVRFTFEMPRLQSFNVNGHMIFTGIPKTKIKLAYTFNEASVNPEGAPYLVEAELDDAGVLVSNLAELLIGKFRVTKLEILKPNETQWKTIDLNNGTTNWERGKPFLEVVDENAVGMTNDTKGSDLQNAILKNYLGENYDLGTNGFQNLSYGIVEE